ncbi:AraC family transcriptional regulator [Streptomyces sp. ASQP_92]|uniref:AraC family transcriptional regulator n=1 Tax=Streptomyces sp. ASQP_92 TaxID=2979116 RepID=UPI0021C1249B|nr:AraC family transcriptional regulator [Streptomyces sp. ASQP_92]MCT9092761.1 AraC family transcriptional regulator [Streptomyces sp. ASQP_92]
MNEGTVSVHLARFILESVRRSGTDMGRFARLPDLDPEVLRDDLSRVSTPTALVLWEQLTLTEPGSAIGALIAGHAPIGTFGLWDYLVTTGENLRETLKRAIAYLECVGDPAGEKLHTLEDGKYFTIRHGTGSWVPEVVEAIDVFALAMFLTRARAATRRPIVPLRVTFSHRPPPEHRRLVEFFGTRNIVFDAPFNSLTFLDDDVRAPLPTAQPGLEKILVRHADLTLAASRPVPRWLDRFRATLIVALHEDSASLEGVAQRLAMSPRTLQRRLGELGTNWREEIEAVRQQHTMDLLRTTDLPLQSIAARVGYSDVRALRRAVHRWEGQPPHALRRAASRLPEGSALA